MLKDSEIAEISKMMKRLNRYNTRLWELLQHTEDAEHDYLMLARDAIGNAHAHLSWVGKEDVVWQSLK